MTNLGFIGFGSMAKMLVSTLLNSAPITQSQIFITRQDKSKLNEVTNLWPEANSVETISEVVKSSEYIFLCVKPLQFKNILEEIKPYMNESKTLVSISGTITLDNIGRFLNCKIVKIMPTIISEVKEGITLICHNEKVSVKDMEFLEGLLSNISLVKHIEEKNFGFISELTSCGPGLISAVFRNFANAAEKHTSSFRSKEIEEMLLYTLYGTAKLMLDKKMNFEDVISRVATSGGITEEGVKVINKGIPPVLNEMFDKTLEKRKVISKKATAMME